MHLLYWPTCPYACKVVAFIKATGLEGKIEKVAMQPLESDSEISQPNPLHKIPVLKTTHGDLYDSRVICEYLDRHHKKPRLFPPAGEKRWTALRQQAIADGIMDAATLKLIEENVREDSLRSEKWIDQQNPVIRKALDALEDTAGLLDSFIHIGHLSIATALSYLTYRYEIPSWRAMHPRLANWYFSVIENPIFAATKPQETKKTPNDLMRLNV